MPRPAEEVERLRAALHADCEQWGLGQVEFTYWPDTDTWAADVPHARRIHGPTYDMLRDTLRMRAQVYKKLGVPSMLRGVKR